MSPLAAGVWGVLATPFDDDLAVDHASLARLVGHYRHVGAAGVVALGVLGEAARLDAAERAAVLRTVVAAAEGLPVVAGIGSISTAPAIEDAVRASEAGASAVMLPVPSGEPHATVEHLSTVARASGLGVVVQDHPASTGVVTTASALIRAVDESGVVVAVKAEAPPTPPTVAALSAALDVPVFGGLGGVSLLDELLAGAAGAMTGFAFPEALVDCVRRYAQGGYAAACGAYAQWLPLVLCEAQQSISLAVRKEIFRRRGLIATARVRPPGADLPESVARALDAHLQVAEHLVPVAVS